MKRTQKGMALFVSLIFLLLLTIVGMASMKSASVQEKMAGNTRFKNISFQLAEAALREGEAFIGDPANESTLASACAQCVGNDCNPPDHTAPSVTQGTCYVWKASDDDTGFYQIQKLGSSSSVMNLPAGESATLYRVTAVATAGNSTTALESIYAKN